MLLQNYDLGVLWSFPHKCPEPSFDVLSTRLSEQNRPRTFHRRDPVGLDDSQHGDSIRRSSGSNNWSARKSGEPRANVRTTVPSSCGPENGPRSLQSPEILLTRENEAPQIGHIFFPAAGAEVCSSSPPAESTASSSISSFIRFFGAIAGHRLSGTREQARFFRFTALLSG
jgi:hypothetical protein